MPVRQFLEWQHHREYRVGRTVQVKREDQVIEVKPLDVDALHQQRENRQQQEHQAWQIVGQEARLDGGIEARVLSGFEQGAGLREPGDKNEKRDADYEVESQRRCIRATTTVEELGRQRAGVEKQRLDRQCGSPVELKALFDDLTNQAPDRPLEVDVLLAA